MSEPRTVPIALRAAREALSTWDGFFAFGFGTGLLPRAPGTWGSLLAVPLYPLLATAPGVGFWLLWSALFVLGAWCAERVGRRLGVDDYGGIVCDEMVAIWGVAAFAPDSWLWWLAAFAVFRFFDILKPWPVGWVEGRFSGGLAVMLDDVLAGVYTIIIIAGAARVLAG